MSWVESHPAVDKATQRAFSDQQANNCKESAHNQREGRAKSSPRGPCKLHKGLRSYFWKNEDRAKTPELLDSPALWLTHCGRHPLFHRLQSPAPAAFFWDSNHRVRWELPSINESHLLSAPDRPGWFHLAPPPHLREHRCLC